MRKSFFITAIILIAFSAKLNSQVNYLFSTGSKSYVPVEDGISPHLVMVPPFNANPPWTLSDEGFARVPIGFTFNYNGKNYDSASICANGFITLGDTIFRRVSPLTLYRNSLAGNPFFVSGVKPLLAPFWDDLDLVDTLNLVYKTTGIRPFRVFTVEWKRTRWTFESTEPALSMEVKLYEKTNIIEFHYKDEGGMPFSPRAFASIGITSTISGRGFLSLQNASADPTTSVIRANDSITTKPATNQVYTFTPTDVNLPEDIFPSISYTNNQVSFNIKADGENKYEYALSNSPVSPVSGIETKTETITASELFPAATYYIYGRSIKNKNFYSQWTADQFTSAVNPVELPWHISGNPNVYPFWPHDVRVQTPEGHFSKNDNVWNVITDFPEIGDTSIWSLGTFYYDASDSWLFTPGLQLTAGKTYQLKFGYLSFPISEPGEVASFEIKYGEAAGAVAMTGGTLFKRDDIVTDFNAEQITFEDTTIEITPDHSGVYYLGIHDLTKKFNGHEGPVPVIRNFSFSEKTTTSQPSIVLEGNSRGTENVVSWKTKDNKMKKIVLEKSKDGIHFTDISSIAAQSLKKNNSTFRPPFKLQRIKGISDAGNKGNSSKEFDEPNSPFEMQVSIDGTNFSKLTASSLKQNISAEGPISHDYRDRDAKGVNYYRLRQTDKKGIPTYSNVVVLKNPASLHGVTVYPNPAKDVLNVSMPFNSNKQMRLLVTDAAGRTVISQVEQSIKNGRIYQLGISQLNPGTYFLKLTGEDDKEHAGIKFVKQ